MKKSIKNIIIIILMVSVVFGVYYFIDKVANRYRWGNATEEKIENSVDNEITEGNVENNESNEEQDSEELVENKQIQNDDIKKIELSDEEIVDILIDADPFDSGIELSTEKKLAIVYNALNENKINAYKNRGESVPVAKNIESDVAAGTMYINYDLYMSNNGKEVVVGSYAIGKSNVTSFVTCKKEM